MNINQFVYNGKRSYDDMKLIITETPEIVGAARDISFVSILGKSGDIIADNAGYGTIEKEYRVEAIAEYFDIAHLAKKITAWLQNEPNYYILTDTYDPNYFRYACFSGKISIKDRFRKLGSTVLKFNCKPFKYSFEGQKSIKLSGTGGIYNPEDYSSLPYLKINGNGNFVLSINNKTFNFTGVNGYIEVDSELMIAYKDTVPQNNKIDFTTFPQLLPGLNNITWAGATSIEIIPKWRAL